MELLMGPKKKCTFNVGKHKNMGPVSQDFTVHGRGSPLTGYSIFWTQRVHYYIHRILTLNPIQPSPHLHN
jgi:hypothetical protein